MTQFDQDIHVATVSDGLYRVVISETWNVNVGPNGGYIGAIILNGMLNEKGRTLSTLSATLVQEERTITIAIATFAPSRETIEFQDVQMPAVASPGKISADRQMSTKQRGHVPFRDHYDQLPAIGPVPPETASHRQFR